ncbi:MAG TPA: hypothetical protein VFX30_04135 [bacterium]|nr:hypothetical protein [bacterium]
MSPIFKIIVIFLLAWPALVSLITGRIYLRSGSTAKGWMPRAFGACLLLAAAVLALYWTGHWPLSLQGAVTPAVVVLLVLAVALQAIF